MKNKLSLSAAQIDNYLEKNQLNIPDASYLNTLTMHLIKGGGKRIRPALMLWFAELLKPESSEKILPIAAAAEIFHTWTLVHDDIIDNDDTRRGLPSTHCSLTSRDMKNKFKPDQRFGTNMGILTGDLQQAWVYKLISESEIAKEHPLKALQVISRISSHLTPTLIAGEAVDIEFEYRKPESINEVFTMMNNKTGSLLQFCAETGVFLAYDCQSYEHDLVIKAGIFAKNCGLAFQLQDDILSLLGDEETIGKPMGSDICAGKQTALMQEFLKIASEHDIEYIVSLTNCKTLNSKQLAKVRSLFDRYGIIKKIMEDARQLIKDALICLDSFPDNKYKNLLAQLAIYMVNRAS